MSAWDAVDGQQMTPHEDGTSPSGGGPLIEVAGDDPAMHTPLAPSLDYACQCLVRCLAGSCLLLKELFLGTLPETRAGPGDVSGPHCCDNALLVRASALSTRRSPTSHGNHHGEHSSGSGSTSSVKSSVRPDNARAVGQDEV